MANYTGSICLSDIDKRYIVTAKNGKKYLNLFIGEKHNDAYGASHYIKIACKKDEVKEGVNYFIGNLKPFYSERDKLQTNPAPPKDDDDLPWD